MMSWLKSLFGGRKTSGEVRELEREIQGLRIRLKDQEETISRLGEAAQRERRTASSSISATVQKKVEDLLEDLATPIVQLTTQEHLYEVERKPVETKDVLALTKRLGRTLADHGLTLEGNVGERVSYDPDRHTPLSADAQIQPGDAVVIRFVGVSYGNRILRKAEVERAQS